MNHWMTDQVIYEIFPDRFEIGHPYTSETKLKRPGYDKKLRYRTLGLMADDYEMRDWNQRPNPENNGKDFFGGDLRGIIDRLNHIHELGATSIYLTPIFFSPSNHKYDIADFFSIDEQFGNEQDLIELIQHLHETDMRLFLDAVLNHTSDIHPWFTAAKKNERPFRDYFTINSDGKAQAWRGFGHLPELNLSSDALLDTLYRRRDSVLQKYLAMGVDGWRFDSAVDLGLNQVRNIREVIQRRFPDAAMIGEVTNFGGEWVCNQGFHGLMNYYFYSSVIPWLREEISAQQMNLAVEQYYQGYGEFGALCSWNILSSHDTPRLKHMLPDLTKRKLAILAQFTLPGVPFIYYGEEIGMEGGPDPDCRRPMTWDKGTWDMDIFDFYKMLIAIRQSHPELKKGKLIVLGHKLNSEALIFIRYTEVPNEVLVVVINNSPNPLNERLLIPHSHLYDGLPMRNLLSPTQPLIEMKKGIMDLAIDAYSGAIFSPDDNQRGFKFFKHRNL